MVDASHKQKGSGTSMLPGILMGAAIGSVVGLLWLLVPLPGSAPPAGQAHSPHATSSGQATAPPAQATSGTGSSSASPTSPLPASGAAATGTDAERDYLRRAHVLVSTAPAEALAMTEAFPTKFPDASLGQEREIVAIEALIALGRLPEARARGKLFLTLFPGSPHRPRLEMMLPGLSAEAAPRER